MNQFYRHILLVLSVMSISFQSKAVLPEDNIDHTLVSLAEDMKVLEQNLRTDIKRFETRQMEFRDNIEALSAKCDEAGIVLYSQDERSVYGELQAAQTVSDIIKIIDSQQKTLTQLENDLSIITSRYKELSLFLEELKKRELTKGGNEALKTSQLIADSLHQSMLHCRDTLSQDRQLYENLTDRANQLGEYAEVVSDRIQNSIFRIGNESFLEIIRHFSTRWQEFVYDLQWRFLAGQSATDHWTSTEDRMYDMLDINTYVSLFLAICFFFLTGIKRLCPLPVSGNSFFWSVSLWLALSIIGIVVIRLIMGFSPSVRMILMLESELYLLAFLILISILVRCKRERIGSTVFTYLPMFLLTLVLIEYREDYVPLSTISFTAPFLYIIALILQLFIMRITYKRIGKFDKVMTWANLSAISICSVMVFIGYNILAMMVFLLWSVIVAGLLLAALLKTWILKKKISYESIAGITLRLFISPLIFPILILVAFIWVCHVYDLTNAFRDLIVTPFLNMPDKVGVLSIGKILYIFGLGVTVNYVIALVNMLLRHNPNNRQGKVAVWISVGNIIVWLLYIVSVMVILDINKAGIIAAIGGASVGIGFALKDTFENMFSGISLMTGRLRPGDIMQYDGERGKVLEIGVISTSMETEDGPIMTMPNRQLFEKNFKNMTRNHCVELRHITFDISANNDPKSVRKLILECIGEIDGVDNTRKHVVIIRNFGSGIMRVELKVWIDSEKYLATEPAVREAVFETFRANGVENATFLQKIDTDTSSSIMNNNNIFL